MGRVLEHQLQPRAGIIGPDGAHVREVIGIHAEHIIELDEIFADEAARAQRRQVDAALFRGRLRTRIGGIADMVAMRASGIDADGLA